MKAFITGIAGFAGSHLAEFLLTHTELSVSGLVRRRTQNISHLKGRLELYRGDLFDPLSISGILSEARPDYIFHLAGEPDVPVSYSSPWETFEGNVHTQVNLLDDSGTPLIKMDGDTAVLLLGGKGEGGNFIVTNDAGTGMASR